MQVQSGSLRLRIILHGIPVRLFEAAPKIAPNIRDWGHVRLFSIWEQCLDEAAITLLKRNGWNGVADGQLPTRNDLVKDYLEPLATTPELARVIETNSRVVKITRKGLNRVSSKVRAERPFELTIQRNDGSARKLLARAIIDTSGTWQNPNPIGADGWPAEGEADHADVIAYGIPDMNGAARISYAVKRTLVLGGGHSAANALLDLALLAEHGTGTSITWAVRSASLAAVFGGGAADQLPARGALGDRLRSLTRAGRLGIVMSFAAERITRSENGLMVEGYSGGEARVIGPFDRIIAATGQRPDFSFARELQLDLHPVVESTRQLGPLIDPNLHSCGTVPPHGWRELAHTETDYFVAGIKSYGRAPTFLLLTGNEQVRSLAAHLAGDHAAADEARLVLPETGVCSASREEVAPVGLCCSGAALEARDPCCAVPKSRARETVSACC